MLKIKLHGFFNSGLKVKNKKLYNLGHINITLFVCFLKTLFEGNIAIRYSLKKKNKHNISFIKSNVRYKITKHSVIKSSNLFLLTIELNQFFCNKYVLDNFVTLIHYFTIYTTYINLNYIKFFNKQKYLIDIC